MARWQSAEHQMIARHFGPLAASPGGFGLIDDAAAFTPFPGCDLIITKDAICEGVHFPVGEAPGLIARKALRVNLSDLAAKGANPCGYLVALGMPEDAGDDWVAAFAAGLAEDQDDYGIGLFGGDTITTRAGTVVSITAFGEVPSGEMVRRAGARPGDVVCVTGTIGDAALGLEIALGQRTGAAALLERYRLPRPARYGRPGGPQPCLGRNRHLGRPCGRSRQALPRIRCRCRDRSRGAFRSRLKHPASSMPNPARSSPV